MPKTERLTPNQAAVEARAELARAKEPKSLPELWAIVRRLVTALGIKGDI